jgi:hypothetical protein
MLLVPRELVWMMLMVLTAPRALMAIMLTVLMVLALTVLMALIAMLWRILGFFSVESGILLVE